MTILKSKFKHIFFDVDGTVTESRSKITKEMYQALLRLSQDHDIIFVSGASKEQMLFQTDGFPATYMAQNGNDTPYWKNEISADGVFEIETHYLKIMLCALGKGEISSDDDLVEHRGSQISLSMVGHHAPLEIKKAYDPDKKKRKALLKKFPFKSDKYEVVIAGTTCFDYFLKGMNKGHNVWRMIKEKNWRSDECIYFGDSFFKGGNDETVKEVIKTVKVDGPDDLMKYIVGLIGGKG